MRQGSEMICFLGTVSPDGQPHSAGVGPYMHDGAFSIVTGLTSQKIKHLTANPAATLEGTVERAGDPVVRHPGACFGCEC